MKLKRPHIAKLDEVTITRNGETSIIEYKEKGIWDTNLTIGPEIYSMSDEDILECHNDCIYAQLESIKNYKHIAVEIPSNKPQIKYFVPGGYWIACGDVLRCTIGCNDDGTTVSIDDKEFNMDEFGKLLSTFEGWGMRITIVPEDEIHKIPTVEVKDPDEEDNSTIILPKRLISEVYH